MGVYKRKEIKDKKIKPANSKEQYIVENDELFLIKNEKKENINDKNNEDKKIEFIEKNITFQR